MSGENVGRRDVWCDKGDGYQKTTLGMLIMNNTTLGNIIMSWMYALILTHLHLAGKCLDRQE